jgi:hypothetical protein
MKMTQEELNEILRKHKMWLNDEEGGKHADLSHADLRHADLRHANLSHADLRHANLSHANGILSFVAGQHCAYAFGSKIMIGCQCHTVEHWLENYEQIGQENGYSPQQITAYGGFIKLVKEML